MDFNVKKLAADAGTFLSRAVQVPRGWGVGVAGRVVAPERAMEGAARGGGAPRTRPHGPAGRPAAGGLGDGRGLVPPPGSAAVFCPPRVQPPLPRKGDGLGTASELPPLREDTLNSAPGRETAPPAFLAPQRRCRCGRPPGEGRGPASPAR